MAFERVKIEGLADMESAMRVLTQDLRRKVSRKALREAARPIVQAAKAQAPVLKGEHPYRLPGTVKRSIRVVSSKVYRGQSGEYGVFVTAFKRRSLGGKRSARNPFDPFYWRFLEFGTKKMAARPFMVPAFEAKKSEALRIVQDALARRIQEADRRK